MAIFGDFGIYPPILVLYAPNYSCEITKAFIGGNTYNSETTLQLEGNAVNVTEDLCSGNRLFEPLCTCGAVKNFLRSHQKASEGKGWRRQRRLRNP